MKKPFGNVFMDLSRLFIILILMDQLAFIHSQVTELLTTQQTVVEVSGMEEQLPLVSNISIHPYYEKIEESGLIRLNISWVGMEDIPIDIAIESVEEGDCFFLVDTIDYPLSKKYYISPDERILHPKYQYRSGCVYNISLTSETGFNRIVQYEVPLCVDNYCDCKLYKPQAKILSITAKMDDEFLVKWDENSSYPIKEVNFHVKGKTLPNSYNKVEILHTDLQKHFSTIKIQKIPKGEVYVLMGIFSISPTCESFSWLEFTVPENKHYALIIIIVVFLIIIIGLKHKELAKYAAKVTNILPDRYNRMIANGNETIHIENQIPIAMQTNIIYTPTEFLSGTYDNYEFPRNKITFGSKLGSGNFGQVYQAKAIDIVKSRTQLVAIKIAESSVKETTEDFLAEINIFKKIQEYPHHPNIVRLLGCCTVDHPYLMIMELVPYGDLKHYLLALRQKWKQKNNQIFFPDTSDGVYITPDSPTSPVSLTSSCFPSTPQTAMATIESDLEIQTPLLIKGLDTVLDHTELQRFALQIAKGMAHLEQIPITHRDLAARNILIHESKVLKISDFGLSRKGTYINYKRRNKMPLRWMAIEAVMEHIYNNKSDVWSFGIVLWEIATLGAFPYEKILDSLVINFLQMGNRLERPEVCTDELYALMLKCWEKDPDNRPSFKDLVEQLDEKKTRAYVDFSQLNPTYVFPPSDINT